jgi:hypothetical protein
MEFRDWSIHGAQKTGPCELNTTIQVEIHDPIFKFYMFRKPDTQSKCSDHALQGRVIDEIALTFRKAESALRACENKQTLLESSRQAYNDGNTQKSNLVGAGIKLLLKYVPPTLDYSQQAD